MTTDFASLVVLTYKRPDQTRASMESLLNTTYGTPYELIVVDDGSRDPNWPMLMQCARNQELSTFIVNAGRNMGVGHGFNRGFQVARGKWLAKLDADLEYKEGWLDQGVRILETFPGVGMVGFFDYKNYNPADTRFEKIDPLKIDDVVVGYTVTDFVGSAFLVRRDDYLRLGIEGIDWQFRAGKLVAVATSESPKWIGMDEFSDAFAEDVMWKQRIQKMGYTLAITVPDTISNHGFGLGLSTVVVPDHEGKPTVSKIAKEPLLFGKKRKAM